MVQLNAIQRNAQRSQGSCQSLSVKSNSQGNPQVAKLSNYLCTREALWRLLATYPKDMTVREAVIRARVDFTKCRKEVTV